MIIDDELPYQRLVKVSAISDSVRVAGAIAGMIREGLKVRVQAIGKAALYRTVQSITTATEYLKEDNLMLLVNASKCLIIVGDLTELQGYKFDLIVKKE